MPDAAVAFVLVLVFAFVACRGLGWVEGELSRQGPARWKAHEEIGRRK